MPKNYTRRYRRKRYTKKTFSKSNLYKHKSPKSQALQIYKLNKKVNSIERLTKPEIKPFKFHVESIEFINGTAVGPNASIMTEYHGMRTVYENVLLNSNNEGYINLGDDDKLLRLQSLNLNVEFGNRDFGNLLIKDTASNMSYYYQNPYTAYLKIIVCKFPYGGGRRPSRITQSIKVNSEDTDENITCITGPLVEGVTSQLKILKIKTLKISQLKTFTTTKIRLGRQVYRKPADTSESAYGKNEIIIYYQFFIPDVIKIIPDIAPERNVYPQCYMRMFLNGAYVNED